MVYYGFSLINYRDTTFTMVVLLAFEMLGMSDINDMPEEITRLQADEEQSWLELFTEKMIARLWGGVKQSDVDELPDGPYKLPKGWTRQMVSISYPYCVCKTKRGNLHLHVSGRLHFKLYRAGWIKTPLPPGHFFIQPLFVVLFSNPCLPNFVH